MLLLWAMACPGCGSRGKLLIGAEARFLLVSLSTASANPTPRRLLTPPCAVAAVWTRDGAMRWEHTSFIDGA
jgi:hypothetical protein